MYFIYSALLAVGTMLSLPFWLWKMLGQGKYRAGLGERLGRVPERIAGSAGRSGDGDAIWIHAVSVGEVVAVTGLVAELQRRYPDAAIFVSTTTATGQKIARERFGEARVFYFPLDFGFAIRPWLKVVRPKLVVMAETEFWPNFLRLAKASGAKVAVVNARISDRSLPGYRRWRGVLRPVLGQVDLFLAQSDEDARRLVEIGAAEAGMPERVQVSGNLKFDASPPQENPFAEELQGRLAAAGAGPVLVCGSTTASSPGPSGRRGGLVLNEESVLLAAFAVLLREFPDAVMVLAPRHPERFGEVGAMLEASGLGWWRRSQLSQPVPERGVEVEAGADTDVAVRGGVLLLDSIGELASVYAVATLAFVGGSLVARGGHNILEPAHFAVPILVGPHTENFRDMVRLFEQADAVEVIHDAAVDRGSAEQLAQVVAAAWMRLLQDPKRAEMGLRGQQVLQQQRGATERTVAAMEAWVSL